MTHTEDLTRYIANFIDELVKSGVTDVVISPGSRSTPLAMTVVEHPKLKEWIIIDERSAAFFALGIAKQTNRSVALICTSGTAAANYYPAVVEATYSRVPLIVLTADRPHELRDVGAPQAIDQIDLYGDYPKWFHEMALPESSPQMLNYSRSCASKAISTAQMEPAGPVHLNFPLREPLVPDFTLKNLWMSHQETTHHPVYNGAKRVAEGMLSQILKKVQARKRGVIVCGPQIDSKLAKSLTQLAKTWGLPILADPLSQLRSGAHKKNNIIEGYDAFLRDQSIREILKPDFIIRFGAMPVSKAYLFYVQENDDIPQFVVENNEGYRDPSGINSAFIYANPILFCEDAVKFQPNLPNIEGNWLTIWQQMNQITRSYLSAPSQAVITEGEAVRALLEVIPEENQLYVGNSMAIRDVDTFFTTTTKKIKVLANRGANGIDGMVSSALGAAATTENHVTLLLGDLSFFHDLNGLLTAKHYGINITILLINNNGGGIFSFLPQAKHGKHFEALFGTPIDIEFKKAIEMYNGTYFLAENEESLKTNLKETYNAGGLSVIEVKTDRTKNSHWHQKLWNDIHEKILKKVR